MPKFRLGAANTVTIIRILLIPVFLVVMLVDWPSLFPTNVSFLYAIRPWLAALVFTFLAATDAVDGYLARSRNEVTTFGMFVDPLADKILVTAALVALIQVDVLPAWVALVIITREFVVSGLRMIASAEGLVIAASWYGKLKTTLQIIAIVMFIVMGSPTLAAIGTWVPTVFGVMSWVVMGAAIIMTILSMVDYFNGASHVLIGPWSDASEQESASPQGATKEADDSNGKIAELAELLGLALSAEGATVGTAESLTGGNIARAITCVPGASGYFRGSIVAYAESVKVSQLGVDVETLEHYGVVSEACAIEMASGGRHSLDTDLCISTTGNAGPSSSGDGEVGEIWIAADYHGSISSAHLMLGNPGREAVRYLTTEAALKLALDAINGSVTPPR